ncbi:MAG: type II secretion system F family protein [Gammaproteobacteria bacterium]|nr:type II secretion system F family protein [Gammaproteobacteria bacterium]
MAEDAGLTKPSLGSQLRRFAARKPTSEDRLFFTEQLALLLETGTALLTALQSLRKQIGKPAMAALIDDLIDNVTEGNTFSHALSKHPELFSATYINLVAAAESGGFMHRVLEELVNMEEKREELRSTVSSALSYPGFLLVFSFAVVIFVLVAVFPKFADLFEGIQDELPVTTVFLMGVSRVLLAHWVAILIGLAAVVIILVWWFRTETGIEFIDRVKMRTPLLKGIFIQVYLIQSLRVMGLSMANGVSVPDTLVSCREVVSNKSFQDFLNRVEKKVSEGAGFAIGFMETDFIPVTVKQMISTGEESGNLPKVLGRISEYYERELNKRLATFARTIEPLMLVFMGGVVGLIVSSLILPIFKLSQSV